MPFCPPAPTLVLAALLVGVLPAAARTPAEKLAQQADRLLAEELGASPGELAPRCDDATFLRRAYLDIVGDIPSPEHVTAFLLDPAEDKRAELVRALLDQPQYGQNWSRYWRDVILYRRIEDRSVIVAAALVPQLAEMLNVGVGWDRIADKFITATGDIQENGATAIIAAQEGRTEEVAAEVSRVFLGIQIQCAQCHDHPWDSWQREQFHELAAYFPRVSLQQVRSPVRRSFEVAVTDREAPRRRQNDNRGSTEHFMPDMDDPQAEGTRMQPKFFLTSATTPLGTRDAERRATISEYITESPWFAKAMVNRMWAELVGEPFFETIDDIGPERAAKAPQTLEVLSQGFADSGYDVKWLMRAVMATDAYQRECRPRRTPDATPMTANVAQRLRGDQLYNALLTALGIEEELETNRGRGGRRQLNQRAQFNVAFGFDPSVDREGVSASIPQALAMMNTPRFNNAVRARRGTMLGELTTEIQDDGALVDELYLRCLSREPTAEERDAALAYRVSVDKRETAFEDLLWALVNSAEFAHRR
ncbi:hypothetical protein Pla123a_08400 [Posidoniimonas polymericola]|uniref:DUF1549 domain-containing protein n=1 Tax=Posidoniimonas polymericola TaxID=2528002 RepID=A0A5C5YTC0_9BACT|nr:DUF1549 domain-containing protein [Posidoniimonas polymericola]TWT78051.1 hypothetical protein Pla123a_08400 [Posidoniimonas polymericola]